MVGPSGLSVLWDSKCTLNHRLIVTLDNFGAFSEFKKENVFVASKSWSGLLNATTRIHILSKWYDLPRFCYRQWNWGGLRIGPPKMCCGILVTALVSHFNCCVPSLCCEVARLAAVLQLAKTTWAPWSFISHGIYDPKIDSRNALPLNVFFKGIYWIVSSRFFKILCGRHKVQSLPLVYSRCFAIHRKKSGFSRCLKHPRILAFMYLYRTSESCRFQTTVMETDASKMVLWPKMWTSSLGCLSYWHFNLPA